jgi:hypothetical protein
MTRKIKNTKTAVQRQKKKKQTPFGDTGAIVGQRLGSMFNFPQAKGIGRWLGTGIGSIFGSGDYTVMGSNPDYNVLVNGNQIPKFNTQRQTNVVCHREYLGDIIGTAGFSNTLYPLNPGMSQTFPWLASIASNYQQYKWHGIIFEFRPLITDFVTSGAPGVVVMATNYNADLTAYTTKQQMENSEYAVSVKPTKDLIHGIECATAQTVLSELYVRTGTPATGQDLRLYDLGSFQFATQANPVQTLGELWVSYCVEFFKPILPEEVGGEVLSANSIRSGVTAGSPLGTIQTSLVGDLATSTSSNSFQWLAQPANRYMVTYNWTGSAAAVVTYPSRTYTGLANNRVQIGPQDLLTGTTSAILSEIYTCTLTNPGNVTVLFGFGGVFPSGTTAVNITITEVSNDIL